MREVEKLTGMVIKASPVGEMDKRLVLLTRERGKITAFARGARRPGSQLMGASRPFAFGLFYLYEGRNSYTLQSAEITNYFEDLALDMEAACYGSYFLELADYYSRENENGTGLLKLLYQSVRALLKPSLKNELVQRVFELKSMVINGEYTESPPRPVSDSANYAWEYVIASPVEHLYTFTLTDPVLEEFGRCVEINKKRYVDREFHSLEILQTMRQ
ncbi:DNA repair protein RecO [Lacrimispora sp. JR3]|uniref:DNA repair protein RecO n=1 Tax=Lacrimispora sinapis TaxID=3111456 RepID=UPI0037498F46